MGKKIEPPMPFNRVLESIENYKSASMMLATAVDSAISVGAIKGEAAEIITEKLAAFWKAAHGEEA